MSKDKEAPTPKTVNVATTNTPAAAGMPLLNISMADKFYLATARSNDETLHYVYTLFCRQRSSGTYNMIPETDIAAFSDQKSADIYYGTIRQIVEYNKRGNLFEAMMSFADIYIQDFEQRMR